MSRARHKEHKRAEGGRLSSEPKWNAGGEQNAAKEAEEKKKGGRVHHEAEGEHAKKRMDKRARGGAVARKHGGHVEEKHEEKEKKHEHKGRAKGGRIGANLMPLSTAARVKHVTKGEQEEGGGPDGSSAENP
jgi:hypothetical protein